MLRTAYQIEDMRKLHEVQTHFRTTDHHGKPMIVATTKRKPQRADELLDGGSLYWIMKNQIQCRQEILDIEEIEDRELGSHCRIFLDPQIIRVAPRAKRAIQGWRYLQGWDAPKDLGPFNPDEDGLPEDLANEIRNLGVI